MKEDGPKQPNLDDLSRRGFLRLARDTTFRAGAAVLAAKVGLRPEKAAAQEGIRAYSFDEAVRQLGFKQEIHHTGERTISKPRLEELSSVPGTIDDTRKWIGELKILFESDYRETDRREREAIAKGHVRRVSARLVIALPEVGEASEEGKAVVRKQIWRDEHGAIESFPKDRAPLFNIVTPRGVTVEVVKEMRYRTSERFPTNQPVETVDEMAITDESRSVGIGLDRTGSFGRVDFSINDIYSRSRDTYLSGTLFLTFYFDIRGDSVGDIRDFIIQGLDRVEKYCDVARESGMQLSSSDFFRQGETRFPPDDPVYRGGMFALKPEVLERLKGTSHLRGLLNYFLTLPLVKI